ncbi:MAG: AsmA-like C-terminal region-containing protein [Crocinitomicaceae bacterium]
MKSLPRLLLKWFFLPLVCLVLVITLLLYLFQDRICQMALKEVNAQLKTPVHVSDVELTFWSTFPNVSVDFHQLHILEFSPGVPSRDTLIYTDLLRLTFNPWDIYKGKYHVKKMVVGPGKMAIRFDVKGNPNYDIFKRMTSNANADFKLSLKEVSVESFYLSYEDAQHNHALFTKINETLLKGDLSARFFELGTFGSLRMLKLKSGQVTLLKNKDLKFQIALAVDQKNGTFSVKRSTLRFENLPFSIRGEATPKQLHFDVHSQNIHIEELVKELMFDSNNQVKALKGKGEVGIHLSVKGKSGALDSLKIHCDFHLEKGVLIEPTFGQKISGIALNGYYDNQTVSGEVLALKDFRFHTIGGSFFGNGELCDFQHPKIRANAKGVLHLPVLHALFKLPNIDRIKGNLDVDAKLRLATNMKSDQLELEHLQGKLMMKAIGFKFRKDSRVFSGLNGGIFLQGNQVGIMNATLKVGTSDLLVHGNLGNVFAYYNGSGNLTSNLNLSSNHLITEDFSATNEDYKMNAKPTYTFPEHVQGELKLLIQHMRHGTHRYHQVKSNVQLKKHCLELTQLGVIHSGAKMEGSLTIEEKWPAQFELSTNLTSKKLNIKSLFGEWNNFDQSVVKEENISGIADVFLDLKAPFHLGKGIDEKKLTAKINVKITGGHLKNLSSFRDIAQSLRTTSGKLVLGNNNIDWFERKLNDVAFETMEQTIHIQHGRIEIPKTTIRSSALDIDLSGKHSFQNEIDYRFAFRLRDLKEQLTQSEFGDVIDDGTGIRLFLRMYGTVDNPSYSWDGEERKDRAKEYRKNEKIQAKSMLKAEFGFFGKDTSVKEYVPKVFPKEEIKIHFGPSNKQVPPNQKKKRSDSKLKKTLNTWKIEQEKEQGSSVKIAVNGS